MHGRLIFGRIMYVSQNKKNTQKEQSDDLKHNVHKPKDSYTIASC